MTPPQLDRVVKACLEKDADERWQAASDLCRELTWISEGGSQTSVSAQTGTVKGSGSLGRREKVLSVVALLLVAAITGLAFWNLRPSLPRPVSRLMITLPPGQELGGIENGAAVTISPDGTHLAYVATQGGSQQIYLRAMDSLEARPIPGTEGATEPFFSLTVNGWDFSQARS